MISSKYGTIWKLLSDYTFEIEPSSFEEDLTCVICNEIMIDACHSVCGCQYCHKCISNFLEEGDKYCPGGKQKCNEEYLSLETDVWRNMRMNKKIARYVVKCPNEMCQVRLELSEMERHLRECTKPPNRCPLVALGCNHGRAVTESISSHMLNEVIIHSRLLVESIGSLKEEITGLKGKNEIKTLEIESLKTDSMLKEKLMDEQRREIESMKNDFERKMMAMEAQMKKMHYEIENKMSSKIEAIEAKETTALGNRSHFESNGYNGLMERERLMAQLNELKNAVMEIKDERTNMRIRVDHLRKDVMDMKDNKRTSSGRPDNARNRVVRPFEEMDGQEEREMNDGVLLDVEIAVDFVWRISQWRRLKEVLESTPTFSDSFYAHNYKMSLRIFLDGDNFGLFCFVMRGEHDDTVQWPIRRSVTLSIVNQDTLRPHKSASFHYDYYGRDKSAFERPSSDRNYYCIGSYPFISYSDIINKPWIIRNDSIVVSCALSEPR